MIKYRHIFDISILLFIITYSYASENNFNDFRLPGTISPFKYKLRIETDLNENNKNRFTFTTIVDIHIKCMKPTKLITLHSRGLKLHSKNIKLHSWNKQFRIVNISTESKYDFLHIHLHQNLRQKHVYKLSIKSSANLHDEKMKGYFRSFYSDGPNAETKWLTVTHFEPVYARTVFPCFDEPGFKATFQISMVHDKKLKALANMPVKRVKENSNKVLEVFEESPPMSTYLVAFMLIDFDFIDVSISNVTIHIWARRNALPQVEYAVSIIPKLLEFYQSYFNTNYTLKKLDLVAMPDFPVEAMENWGLILLRESSLLGKTDSLSIFDKEKITNIIAHKLAQQWFGNLVTMRWWRDVWIKEGFASYFATLAINKLFPKWNYYRFNVLTNFQTVLVADASIYSQPISKLISSPEDIEQPYEDITYKKAALIVRQLQQQLTADKFKIGIKTFLKTYKFQNANESEVWASLTNYAKSTGMLPRRSSYEEMMTPWTLSAGFPLVNVIRNYKQYLVDVMQNRYFSNPMLQYDTCYWTPLSFVTGIQKYFISSLANLWLGCPKKHISFDAPDLTNKWIIFNNQASGLYRVNYDEANWNMLIKQFIYNYEEIDEISRVLIIDDVMKLSITRHVSYDLAFNLIDYIEDEDKYLPWKTAIDNFNIIASYLDNTPIYELFKKYIIKIINSVYVKFSRIDLLEEQGEKLKFQALLLKTACYYDQQDCMTTLTNLFFTWMNENISIPAHLREVIYCNGVKYGGENEWDFLWNNYLRSESLLEKQEMLKALGCTQDAILLDRYLKLSIDPEFGIKQENIIKIFSVVAENLVVAYIVKDFLYEYIKNNYNQIDKSSLDAYSKILGRVSKTETEINEFQYFIQQYYNEPTYAPGQILDDIEVRKMWINTYYNQIYQILITKTTFRTEQPKYKNKKNGQNN